MEITQQTTFVLSSCLACAKRLKSVLAWQTHASQHISFLKNSVFVCSLRKGVKNCKFIFQLLFQIELAGFCNTGDRTVVTNKMMIP